MLAAVPFRLHAIPTVERALESLSGDAIIVIGVL